MLQIVDISYYDFPTRPYGYLLPGTKSKIPVVIASTIDKYPDHRKGTPFFDTLCTDGHRPINDNASPHIDANVPSRTTDGCGDKSSWARNDHSYEAHGYALLVNNRFSVTNAWFTKSDRSDEPSNTHVRDHVWNVHLHGKTAQHINVDSNIQLLPESNPEFRYEWDYIWRIPRRLGDLRKVPMMAAEVEDMHMNAKEHDDDDSIGIRVHTEDGPLRFEVRAPKSSLPDITLGDMDCSLRHFYGTERMYTTALNRICTTAIVYSLMKNHHITRRAAFEFLGIRQEDTYPVMKDNFYTWDNFCINPSDIYGDDKIWDRRRYCLYGEPLFDGTATKADIKQFQELAGTTWEFLQDVQAMFALDEPLDSELWYGGVKDKPEWRLSVKTCSILSHYLSTRDGIPWERPSLNGEGGLWNVDWDLKWQPWSKARNNRTDYQLLKRLGIVPFLPRIAPTDKKLKDWEWLASYRRRLYPTCVVVWDKLERQTKEVAKFAKMLGEDVDPKVLKESLRPEVVRSGRPESAVFLLGVMELTALKKGDVKRTIMDQIGSWCYVSRD